jgi:hypothetical protein
MWCCMQGNLNCLILRAEGFHFTRARELRKNNCEVGQFNAIKLLWTRKFLWEDKPNVFCMILNNEQTLQRVIHNFNSDIKICVANILISIKPRLWILVSSSSAKRRVTAVPQAEDSTDSGIEDSVGRRGGANVVLRTLALVQIPSVSLEDQGASH